MSSAPIPLSEKSSTRPALGALTTLLYVGAEVGVSSWVVYCLQRRLGLSPVASASGLSAAFITPAVLQLLLVVTFGLALRSRPAGTPQTGPLQQ